MGPVEEAALRAAVEGSALTARYRDAVDRESAYEKLAARGAPEPSVAEPEPEPEAKPTEEGGGLLGSLLSNPMLKSFARSAGTQLGREISRNLFGTSRRRR